MAPSEDALTKLNERLAERQEARGVRGGLGRVKGPKGFADPSTWNRPKLQPAGDDPLYKRFARGPVLGGGAEDGKEAPKQTLVSSEKAPKRKAETQEKSENEGVEGGRSRAETEETTVWKRLVEAALRDAGGSMEWTELRDAVVARRRREIPKLHRCDDELWPHHALAHIPPAYLSDKDSIVRLVK
eukprot:TRINITY_DN57121_c0_g1_i1.p1 TRINITY_DN57121_c0_g1~~TRINITY_DN57121_c0_g1_i1.p1  ORF type:complete len:212 (+),score=51.87 TRINITY_DN57121_c0_g1_i1:81-638(+)